MSSAAIKGADEKRASKQKTARTRRAKQASAQPERDGALRPARQCWSWLAIFGQRSCMPFRNPRIYTERATANKSNKSLYFEAVIVYHAHGPRVLMRPALALKP